MELILETEHSKASGMGKTVTYKCYIDHHAESPEKIIRIWEDNIDVPNKDIKNVLTSIFGDVVDMGHWKHTYHMDISKFEEIPTRDRIKEIISEKISDREDELKLLKGTERLLMAVIPKEPKIIERGTKEWDDLPF